MSDNNGINTALYQLDEFYIDLQNDGSTLRKLDEDTLCQRPYPGLRPFKTSEHELFFGRSGQTNQVIARLESQHFLAVIGSSGTGKSSLVRAGMIPALFGGKVSGTGSNWKVAICRPGNNPIDNLSLAFSSMITGSKEKEVIIEKSREIGALLKKSSFGIHEVYKLLQPGTGIQSRQNLLVIVDQFEELFRFERKELKNSGPLYENIEDDFVRLLLQASSGLNPNIYVVLTMRSEFLGDCVKFKDLPEEINKSQYLVPSLNPEQLRDVIEGPVFRANRKIAGSLTEVLINEIETEKLKDNLDQLPILQHALMRTFNNAFLFGSVSDEMNYTHYERIGGMKKALGQHAREVFRALDNGSTEQENIVDIDDESPIPVTGIKQTIAKMVFQALTDFSAGVKSGRRPTVMDNVYGILEVLKTSREEINTVINRFRQGDVSFIMPPESNALNNYLMLDIAHESLMRNWPDLKAWMEEEASAADLYKKLNERREQYERDKDAYIQGVLLKDLEGWHDTNKYSAEWAYRYRKQNTFESVTTGTDPDYNKNIDFLNLCKQKRLEGEIKREELVKAQQAQIAEEIKRRKYIETLNDKANEAEQEAKGNAQIARNAANRAKRNLIWAVGVAIITFVLAIICAYQLSTNSKLLKMSRELQGKTLISAAEKAYVDGNNRIAFLLAESSDSISGKNETDSMLKKWELKEYSGSTIAASADGSIVVLSHGDSIQIVNLLDTLLVNNPCKHIKASKFLLSPKGDYIVAARQDEDDKLKYNPYSACILYRINRTSAGRISIDSVKKITDSLILTSSKVKMASRHLVYVFKNKIKLISYDGNWDDEYKLPLDFTYSSSLPIYYNGSLILWGSMKKYVVLKKGEPEAVFNRGFDYSPVYNWNEKGSKDKIFLDRKTGIVYRNELDNMHKLLTLKLSFYKNKEIDFFENDSIYFLGSYNSGYIDDECIITSKQNNNPSLGNKPGYDITFKEVNVVQNSNGKLILQKGDSIIFVHSVSNLQYKKIFSDSTSFFNRNVNNVSSLFLISEISRIVVNFTSDNDYRFIDIYDDSLVLKTEDTKNPGGNEYDKAYVPLRLGFYKMSGGITRVIKAKKNSAYWKTFYGYLTLEEKKNYGIK